MRYQQRRRCSALFLILLVTGFACQRSNYINDANAELAEGEWARALRFANAAVKQAPDDPQAHLVRAISLAELGVRKPITERKTYYDALLKTLEKADSLARADRRNGTLSEIKLEWINAWVREYNAGVRILSAKEGVTAEKAAQAARNFEHASLILPDSVVAMVMKARALLIMNEYNQASEMLTKAQEADSSLAERFKYDYAVMFAKAGNYIDALPLFEDLFKEKTDDFAIGSGLYNTYYKMGLLGAADAVMGTLFDLSPSDETLQFNKGVRSYYELEERLRSIIRRARREKIPDQELYASAYGEVEESVQKLESLFTGAANKATDKPVLQYAPGVFYFNLGVLYGELSQFYENRELRLKFLDVRNELFKRSVPYLKISFGAVPNDKEIWNLLYQIYTTLDMKTEADLSLKNASS